MTDWMVAVSARRGSTSKRVFVEDVKEKEEAERLALFRLNLPRLGHEIRSSVVHARVSSVEDQTELKGLYEKAVADLAEAQRELQKEQEVCKEQRTRANELEAERNHLVGKNTLVLNDLVVVKTTLDKIEKNLGKGKRNNGSTQERQRSEGESEYSS